MSTKEKNTCTTEFEYIIYDLETTGLNVEKEHIVEIAAICVSNGKKFHTYVMPPGRGNIGGTDFHGLTRDILREKDAKKSKIALSDFQGWVYRTVNTGKPLCFVSHNNFGYDQLILENEYIRNRMEMINCFYADSCPFFKGMDKFANGRLSTVYETLFEKKLENAHTAEADVEALHACLHVFSDWKKKIPIRIATVRIDDTDLKWLDCILLPKHISELKLYGYTCVAGMVDSVNRSGATFKKLLTKMFGYWHGERIYIQLRHVIRHHMKRDTHEYSTRSKCPTKI